PQHPARHHARPARAQGGRRRRLRRRAPRRSRAPEGDRRPDRRARRAAQAQGRGHPRGLVHVVAGQEETGEPSQSGTPGGQARYVATITDGTGGWAQRRRLPVIAGHEAGADVVKARLRDAAELGIRELTVYSFSTENWSRADAEVAALMEMFGRR